ncbi:MAG UNVERIFIED_CONTAM: hypothetical protein LVR18_11070 [Planctomycetaceae bacterium]|jgi:hypothetical protein
MFHRSLPLTTALLSFAAACVAPVVNAGNPNSAAMLAGVASVEITPGHPVRLNGFGGRSLESQGVRQSLFAKALAVGSTDEDTVIILTVDTLGIPADLRNRVSAALHQQLKLSQERLAICSFAYPQWPNDPQLCQHALWQTNSRRSVGSNSAVFGTAGSRLDQRCGSSMAEPSSGTAVVGIGQVSFALNRRTPGGPVDHDLPVLAIHEPDGALRAVFTNYACHAVTLSDDLLSGDWPGYAMEHIQRLNPGCEALIAIGCGADSDPHGGVLGGRDDVAASLGLELAEAVNRVLRSDLQPVTEPPARCCHASPCH